MKSSDTIKTDCFAIHKVNKNYSCNCLTKMICSYSDNCPFYKSRNLVSADDIEEDIKNYSLSDKEI